MKTRALLAAVVLLATPLGSRTSMAVVRNDDTAGNPGDFPCAIKIGTAKLGFFCSGTVICDGKYVITAAHCIQGLSDLGSRWKIMNQAGDTLMGRDIVRVHPRADLAIICLKGSFDDSYDLYCDDVKDMEVCFTGYGLSSDAAGADGGGPGTGMSELPFGTPRTGYNVLDQNVGANRVGFDFDRPNDATGLGAREGTTFPGDSGMGYLKQVGNEFQLVAVHSGILGARNLNRYGVVSVGVNVQAHKPWIENKGLARGAPEPSAVVLAGIGLGFAILYRRVKRH